MELIREEPLRDMRAVLVASGEPMASDARWLDGADLLVAVDDGARWLARLGVRPDAVIGDMDSVDATLLASLEADGVAVERHPAEKDSSDTELAIAYARRAGATDVVIVGAFGGRRVDHEVANLLLLASQDSLVERGSLALVRGHTRVTAMRGEETRLIDAPAGARVSLFPVSGDAMGVSTSGLRYALDDDVLRMGTSRGLSNVVASVPASVRLREGTLLVIEQLDEGEDA